MKEFLKNVAIHVGLFTGIVFIGAVWFYRVELSYRETETKGGYKTKSFDFRTQGHGEFTIKEKEMAKNDIEKIKVRRI